MALRDFLLLLAISVVWAANNVLNKVIVDHLEAPPLLYAALRFALVAAITIPWLFPLPRPLWRIVLVGLLMGGPNFALIYMGFLTATPSMAAIIFQLGVPITTLFSVVLLGERIRWRRGIGIAITLAGALLVIWNPHGLAMSTGVMLILGGTVANSLGAVLMKQMEGIKPMRYQAWVALVSVVVLTPASAGFELPRWDDAVVTSWPFIGAVLFSGLIVSLLAHTGYYFLIQRYEANLIATLTLITPLLTILLGVLITHDPFNLRMGIGAALALLGVMIVALRPNQVMPLLLAIRNRAQ